MLYFKLQEGFTYTIWIAPIFFTEREIPGKTAGRDEDEKGENLLNCAQVFQNFIKLIHFKIFYVDLTFPCLNDLFNHINFLLVFRFYCSILKVFNVL